MPEASNPDGRIGDRINPADLDEGDTVLMSISLHGTSDDKPGVEYYRDAYKTGVIGTVVERPSHRHDDRLRDGERLMVDFAVEADDEDETVYRWNVDNGYVLGPMPSLGRRTDIGTFAGFYEIEA